MKLIEIDNPSFDYEIGLIHDAAVEIGQTPEPLPAIMTPVLGSAQGAVDTAALAVRYAKAAVTEKEREEAAKLLVDALDKLSFAALQNQAAQSIATQLIQRQMEGIGDPGLKELLQKAGSAVKSATTRVKSALSSAATKVVSVAKTLGTKAVQAVSAKTEELKKTAAQRAQQAKNLVAAAAKKVGTVKQAAITAGKKLVTKVKEGAKQFAAGMAVGFEKIKDVFNDMVRKTQDLFNRKEALKQARARALAKWNQIRILEPRASPARKARIAGLKKRIDQLEAETQLKLKEAETQIRRAKSAEADVRAGKITGIGEIGIDPVTISAIIVAIAAAGIAVQNLISGWNKVDSQLTDEIAALQQELALTREELAMTQEAVNITNQAISEQQKFNEQIMQMFEQYNAALAKGDQARQDIYEQMEALLAQREEALAKGDTALARQLEAQLANLQSDLSKAGSGEYSTCNDLQRRLQELELANSSQWEKILNQLQTIPPISATPTDSTVPATAIPGYSPSTPESAVLPEPAGVTVPAEEKAPGIGAGIAVLAGLFLLAAVAGKPKEE